MPTSVIRTSLCVLVTKANVIKKYFLEYQESVSNDFVFSRGGRDLEFMQRDIDDWKHYLRRHRASVPPSATVCAWLSRI